MNYNAEPDLPFLSMTGFSNTFNQAKYRDALHQSALRIEHLRE